MTGNLWTWAATARDRDLIPAGLMDTGIPSCAVTAIEGTSVLMIASAAHLDHPAQ